MERGGQGLHRPVRGSDETDAAELVALSTDYFPTIKVPVYDNRDAGQQAAVTGRIQRTEGGLRGGVRRVCGIAGRPAGTSRPSTWGVGAVPGTTSRARGAPRRGL